MKRHFTRNKENHTYDLGHSEESLIRVLDEILTEFQWGGQFAFEEDSFTVTTKCFGCIDTTVFQGTKEEIAFFKELAQHRSKPLSFLLDKMGIAREDEIFSRDDVVAAYSLFLEGTPVDDLAQLIDGGPQRLIVGMPTSVEELNKLVDEVKAMKNNPLLDDLDEDDGAHCIAESFVQMHMGSFDAHIP